jgi:tetratricopeptide (TPR) repeat protein
MPKRSTVFGKKILRRISGANLHWSSTTSYLAIFLLAALFVSYIIHSRIQASLLIDLSVASFMVGCLAGFLFSSYGEETATVGKVRDWIVGGLTGLTIAKFSLLRALILGFAIGPGPQQYALVVGLSITFFSLGLLSMFFQRELILNVMLAQSRAERGSLEGTRQAGLVTQQLLSLLPPSLLTGIDDVNSLVRSKKPGAEKLRSLLYSDDVSKFLNDAEEGVKVGTGLDWDVVSKAATLNYYRTYYETGDEKEAQEEKAAEWIVRALVLNPLHADLTAKYADVLGMLERYEEAVAVLERLEKSPEAPAYVRQWLGYFLLYLPNREDEAIQISKSYHDQFPTESDSLFNMACGYAQKYKKELQAAGLAQDLASPNRTKALESLTKSLEDDPDYVEHVRNSLVDAGESFDSLVHDEEFRRIVGLPKEESLPPKKSSQ